MLKAHDYYRRDWLFGNATAQTSLIPTGNITNGTTYSGKTSFGNYTYQTDALYLSGILSNSTDGLNHADSVGGDGVEAVDGLVAVLTIKVVAKPTSSKCVLSYLASHSYVLIAVSPGIE